MGGLGERKRVVMVKWVQLCWSAGMWVGSWGLVYFSLFVLHLFSLLFMSVCVQSFLFFLVSLYILLTRMCVVGECQKTDRTVSKVHVWNE